MTPSLLYIDDENENLKVFQRIFKKNFKIYTALSGEEGLNIFEQHPEISLLASDQRMPEMSGIDFLNACKQINPNPIRILITGYADLESTIHAINEAEIYRFIKKPWEKLDLLQTLNEAQRRFELEKEIRSLDELKNRFMILVNHELKTPLTIQRSYLELLKKSTLDKEQSLYLKKSLLGSNRLETLISEILYFLKVQKENLLDTQETFKLSQATGIQSLIETFIKTNKIYFCDAIKRLIQNAETHKIKNSNVTIKQKTHYLIIQNSIKKPLNLELIIKPFEINEDAFNHTKGLGLGLSIASLILSKLGFPMHVQSNNSIFKVSVDLSEKQSS